MITRLCATILLILLSCGVCLAAPKAHTLPESFVAAASPSPVPDLLFKDGDGKEHNLRNFLKNELNGRYVLLSVWAPWCLPCLQELPSLDRLQGIMGSRLAVVALAQDRDGLVRVPAYFQRHSIKNLKVYFDDQSQGIRRLGLKNLPASLLVGPDGQEIGRVLVPLDWAEDGNVRELERLVGN